MIHIEPKPEPEHFDVRVRQRGSNFLASVPSPTEKQWKSHRYWSEVSDDIYALYGGICAYSCHWISPDTGWRHVEHFKPKAIFPQLAYEWSNYRLASGILNERKGIKEVLDPFVIENGWFIIDFSTLKVRSSPALPQDLEKKVEDTCDILGLNDESTCMKNRARYIELYCKDKISFQHLVEDAPFIAMELRRQGLVDSIKNMMIY
jgi:hypothetical protein